MYLVLDLLLEKNPFHGEENFQLSVYSNVREYMENVAHVCENYPSQYKLILKIV